MPTDPPTYEHVIYEKLDNVAVITLNRPERLNAMGAQSGRDVQAALRTADDDEEVHAPPRGPETNLSTGQIN